MSDGVFRLWAAGCSHVDTDLYFGRDSLGQAIRQSERGGEEGGPAYDWDIALHLGDLVGCLPLEEETRAASGAPTDAQGREVVRQFSALQDHRREDIYNLAGNHDASPPGQPCQWWFRKWIDPMGEHPGAIDTWLGGHTHTHPDDRTGGRSHIERKWDVTFINAAALTRHHVNVEAFSVPMSRLLTFTEGRKQVRVQCYLHTSDYAPQGWYNRAERILRMTKPYAA